MKRISIFSILLLLLSKAVAVFCVQNKPALPEEESSERKEEDGYRYGTQGLILTWVVAGVICLAVQPIGRAFGCAKNLSAAENFILAGGLAMTF
ncbi:hypothetical protein AHAS_Ahas04G0226900 [Arachis hypogaea]